MLAAQSVRYRPAVTPSPTPTPSSTPVPLGLFVGNVDSTASGTPNTVGYYPGFDTQFDGFVSTMGRGPTYLTQYYDQSQSASSWNSYTNYMTGTIKSDTRSANLIPVVGWPFGTTPEGNIFSAISGGTYDTVIQQSLSNWKTGGFNTLYIRPAWEFNLPNIYQVTSSNVSAWIAAWQHFYTLVHNYASSIGLTVKIIWNPNVGNNQADNSVTVAQMYPGNAYVDVLGIDTYGQPSGGPNAGGTSSDPTEYLVTTMVSMSASSGIPISFPESGCSDTGFATAMVNYLTNRSPKVKIEFFGFWDADVDGNYSFTNSWDNQATLASIWVGGFGPGGSITN